MGIVVVVVVEDNYSYLNYVSAVKRYDLRIESNLVDKVENSIVGWEVIVVI